MNLLAVAALIGAVVLLVHHMGLKPGLATLAQADVWMPAGLLALDQQVVVDQPLLRLAFAVASAIGLLIGAWRLWSRRARTAQQAVFDRHSAWAPAAAAAAAAAVAGLVLVRWGVAMGLPSFETLTGGTLFLWGGLITLGFAAWLAWASARGLDAWADEWAMFVLTCLVATPSFYLWWPLVAWFDPAPAFVAAGHVYRTTGVGQWALIAVPFVAAMHNRATQQKRAR